MHPDSRIFVAGHRGLAGSAICRRLHEDGHRNVIVRGHADLDLRDAAAVNRFFAAERPEYVFLAAAKVGGILPNSTRPAEFIHDNLAIQTSVIEAARANLRSARPPIAVQLFVLFRRQISRAAQRGFELLLLVRRQLHHVGNADIEDLSVALLDGHVERTRSFLEG